MGRAVDATSLALAAVVCALFAGGAALAEQPLPRALLVDEGLEPRSVSLVSIRDGQVSYFDEQRMLQREPMERFVQLRTGREAGAVAGAELELTDGQVLAGGWAGEADQGQAVVWAHPTLGELEVPLDRIAGISFLERGDAAHERLDAPAGQDVVLLRNGDRLTGFIQRVEAGAMLLELEDRDEAVELALDRVAGVRLGNPEADPPDDAELIQLTDGSRVLGDGLRWRGETFTFRPAVVGDENDAASPVEMGTDAVARIDIRSGGLELVELAELPWQVVTGGEVFGLSMLPRAEGGALRMHAPVRVVFELPAGAKRAAGVAEIDTTGDAPAHMLRWVDFELIVEAGSEPMRARLNAERPQAAFNLAIKGGGDELAIELEPGRNGPVLDRMRLREGVVLIER